ncbi:unnamed protein product [Ectocarpus sp. CCAP 1310/34]|nr:unnamed protein product [Ectocarpus sp. CCAP 1310/34]
MRPQFGRILDSLLTKLAGKSPPGEMGGTMNKHPEMAAERPHRMARRKLALRRGGG